MGRRTIKSPSGPHLCFYNIRYSLDNNTRRVSTSLLVCQCDLLQLGSASSKHGVWSLTTPPPHMCASSCIRGHGCMSLRRWRRRAVTRRTSSEFMVAVIHERCRESWGRSCWCAPPSFFPIMHRGWFSGDLVFVTRPPGFVQLLI